MRGRFFFWEEGLNFRRLFAPRPRLISSDGVGWIGRRGELIAYRGRGNCFSRKEGISTGFRSDITMIVDVRGCKCKVFFCDSEKAEFTLQISFNKWKAWVNIFVFSFAVLWLMLFFGWYKYKLFFLINIRSGYEIVFKTKLNKLEWFFSWSHFSKIIISSFHQTCFKL